MDKNKNQLLIEQLEKLCELNKKVILDVRNKKTSISREEIELIDVTSNAIVDICNTIV